MSDKTFSRMMVTCLLSIVLCMVVLVSTTWAWFEDSVVATSTLTAGDFSATGTVSYTVSVTSTQTVAVQANDTGTAEPATVTTTTDMPAGGSLSPSPDGSLTFTALATAKDNTYTITLTANVTAEQGGFFLIYLNGKTTAPDYNTAKIARNGTFTFCVQMVVGESLRIIPCWGTPNEGNLLNQDGTIATDKAKEAALAAAKAAATASAPAETNAVGIPVTPAAPAETNAVGVHVTPAETNAAS